MRARSLAHVAKGIQGTFVAGCCYYFAWPFKFWFKLIDSSSSSSFSSSRPNSSLGPFSFKWANLNVTLRAPGWKLQSAKLLGAANGDEQQEEILFFRGASTYRSAGTSINLSTIACVASAAAGILSKCQTYLLTHFGSTAEAQSLPQTISWRDWFA